MTSGSSGLAGVAQTGDNGAATRCHELAPLPPYDFDIALAYFHSSPSSVLEAIDLEAGCYQRALNLGGRDVLLTINSIGSVDAPRLTLNVEAESGEVNPKIEAEAVAFARHVFRLDDDPVPFTATALQDPVLHRLAQHFRGVRPLLVADPYEHCCSRSSGNR